MRSELLTKTVQTLEDYDFNILLYLHSCLDIAAQKKRLNLLIKVLENIDGFRREHAEELKRLSSSLNACPLIIGETTKAQRMAGNTLYDRHSISAVTLETFQSSLDGAFPERVFSRGRVIVEIDGDALEAVRKKKKITREKLAEEAGLTKEAVYFYERGGMKAREEAARMIEQFLDTQLTRTKSPFRGVTGQESVPRSHLEKKLTLFDFNVYSFNRMNFDVVARDARNKVVVRETPARDINRLMNFSDFFHTLLAIVGDEKDRDTAVVERHELLSVETKRDFLKLLREKTASTVNN
jgi:predicted transcriptional regulator